MRSKKIWTLVAALALFAGGSAIAASAVTPSGWSFPFGLALSSQQADNVQVVGTADGTLTAVWQQFDGTDRIIQSSHSPDGGFSWSPPASLSAPTRDASFPRVVAAANNSVTAIWDRFNGVNFTVQSSHSADGVNWGPPAQLAIIGGEASAPQIVASPNSAVTAVWQGFVGGTTTIQSSHSADGVTWSGATSLSAAGGAATNPQIAPTAGSSLTAVWSHFDGANFIVQSSKSGDGVTWSSVVDLSQAGQDALTPQIAGSPSGAATTVWARSDGSTTAIQSNHSTDGGATWGGQVNLSSPGQNAQTPKIALASDGAVSAVWSRFNGSNFIVQSSYARDGVTWSSPADLSAVGQDALDPQIAGSPATATTAIWSRFDGSNTIIQSSVSTDGSATWKSPTNLSAVGHSADSPQITATPSGITSASWSRFDGSSFITETASTVIPLTIISGALPTPQAGVAYSFPLRASGIPKPTFAITGGSLPLGLTLSTAGIISGTPTTAGSSAFSVTMSNGFAADTAVNYTLMVVGTASPSTPPAPTASPQRPEPSPSPSPSPTIPISPTLHLEFNFTVGDHANGGTLNVIGTAFEPDSVAVVTLHSTPSTLATIPISASGSFTQSAVLPQKIDPGAHHVEVAYAGLDGVMTSQSWYFRVDRSDVVTNIQTQPTAVPPPWAHTPPPAQSRPSSTETTIRGVTYQQYLPASHPAAAVDTEISTLVLLTILGGVGAASIFGASGPIAMAAGAAAAGGGRGKSSSSGTGEGTSASLASAKVKHLKFKSEAIERGDRSSTWAWIGLQRIDRLSVAMPGRLNTFSPLLARVANDGTYLRAMFGPLGLLGSVAGLVLGVLSVGSTGGAAVPPATGLVIAVVVLSVFDVAGGLIAATAFTIGVGVLGGLNTVAAGRTMLGIDVIFFTVVLAASAARPLRRVAARSATDWFDRTADVVLAALIGTWAVTKMIGALPALAGLELPLAKVALPVALCAGGAIVSRYALETVATYYYPLRLASVAPPKIGFPSPLQQVTSAFLKTALFVFIAIAYLGNSWPLWGGAALFLIPSVVAAFQNRFPNVPRLVRFIPGGVIKIVLLLCVGKFLGGWLVSTIHDPHELIGQSFVILAIPSLLIGIAAFFGRDGTQWGLNWPARIGGVVLVAFGVLLVVGAIRIT